MKTTKRARLFLARVVLGEPPDVETWKALTGEKQTRTFLALAEFLRETRQAMTRVAARVSQPIGDG